MITVFRRNNFQETIKFLNIIFISNRKTVVILQCYEIGARKVKNFQNTKHSIPFHSIPHQSSLRSEYYPASCASTQRFFFYVLVNRFSVRSFLSLRHIYAWVSGTPTIHKILQKKNNQKFPGPVFLYRSITRCTNIKHYSIQIFK